MVQVIQATAVNEQIKQWDEKEYAIVDVRFNLSKPNEGKELYEKGHIPRAIYMSLEKDLSSPRSTHGGRNPFPNIDQFSQTLGNNGISNDTYVIVYDDQGGTVASRFAWLLKHIGHQNVAILNGGYSSWVREGFASSTEIPVRTEATYKVQINESWSKVDAHELLQKLDDPNVFLIDSRSPSRYSGAEEPLDPVGGHIPGAKNYFWKNVLSKGPLWKNENELKETFATVPKDKEVIVYCGSGVSACPTVIALQKLGYENVKLYPGSWSDWITYSHFPIAKNE